MSKKKAPAEIIERGPRRPSDVTLRLIGYEWSTFRDKLADAIEEHELTKDQLAEKAGVSPSLLTRLPENMAWWSAVALARALGVTMGELLGEKPSANASEQLKVVASPDLVEAHEMPTDKGGAPRKPRK